MKDSKELPQSGTSFRKTAFPVGFFVPNGKEKGLQIPFFRIRSPKSRSDQCQQLGKLRTGEAALRLEGAVGISFYQPLLHAQHNGGAAFRRNYLGILE